MKKILLLLLGLTIFMLPPSTAEAGGPDIIVYETPVKVKLLPEKSFSVKPSGSYQLVNLDTDAFVPLTDTLIFSQTDEGKISLEAGADPILSASGFAFEEAALNSNNELKLTSIKFNNSSSGTFRGSLTITPGENVPTLYNILDMEDYLKGVVASEMPSSWPMEALKAQAVAARSYAYMTIKYSGYVNATVASQVYGGKTKETARTNQAISETNGIYATYNGNVIHAYFHSSSGGYTENSENVWSSKLPYIRAVHDPYDKHTYNSHYGWNTIIPSSTMKSKLGLSGNSAILSLKVTDKTVGGSVQQLELSVFDPFAGKKTLHLRPDYISSPDGFRWGLGKSLKSTKFSIEALQPTVKIKKADGSEVSANHTFGYKLQKADGSTEVIQDAKIAIRLVNSVSYYDTAPYEFSFTGSGWGHGLGMSQWGARGMADAGFTYDDILKKYYTGIELQQLN